MSISVGDKLPEATFVRIGANGPEEVTLSSLTKGRKVVIFAVPGAFTPTCHSAHMPSFIDAKDQLKAKGVDEIICVAVNDAFVMHSWAEATGASKAGITLLSDGDGAFAKSIGMVFDAPPVGLFGRSKRYAMAAEDGVVTVWHPETTSGCEISGGAAMVEAL
ncbi:peroxiredoxin [Pararhodobacter oceanensis]|uniref:peroxiredoxin n=1 Tax=Pararhodobacter oceanensis TaxID=2172121 RepID=UPI003A94478F